MLGRYKQLKESLDNIRRIVDDMLEIDADTWSRINKNKTALDELKKGLENIHDWMTDIDEIQMLQTGAIDELRDNVALILDHLGVEVVQPSDKPTIKKKGSK
jgi:hypothetical protein|uniref:Uncharacterized protein n=1 Tax=Podoviridae sp. ctdDI2 TaxID=2826567 RepID=A0A8S5NRY0_9CAUD|nr:MAG TPA: hypothetical protein [Podoviridae sp. ctdDI2]